MGHKPSVTIIADRRKNASHFLYVCLFVDKKSPRCYDKNGAGEKTEKAVGYITPKGGVDMLITVTFYVRDWAITVQVKCRNRHSAK